jgi:hypothetical protein
MRGALQVRTTASASTIGTAHRGAFVRGFDIVRVEDFNTQLEGSVLGPSGRLHDPFEVQQADRIAVRLSWSRDNA